MGSGVRYVSTSFILDVENEHADARRDGRTYLARPNSQARTVTGTFCVLSLFSWPRAGLATLPSRWPCTYRENDFVNNTSGRYVALSTQERSKKIFSLWQFLISCLKFDSYSFSATCIPNLIISSLTGQEQGFLFPRWFPLPSSIILLSRRVSGRVLDYLLYRDNMNLYVSMLDTTRERSTMLRRLALYAII